MAGKLCGPCGSFTMMSLAFMCDECGHAFNVPRCLAEEVRWLHSKGVHVRGATCLRFHKTGYIKVVKDHEAFMQIFDYESIPIDDLDSVGDECCCFVPKTTMPVEKMPERWEDWVKRNG